MDENQSAIGTLVGSLRCVEPYGRYLNVVDVEATCWPKQPPPGQLSEIIEIGLCVVDSRSVIGCPGTGAQEESACG